MSTASAPRYHHGNLAHALLDAGFEACRKNGPNGVAVRDLADRVGVSPAAAYRHFASLDHLRAAVAQRAREQLAQRMIAAREAETSTASTSETANRKMHAIGAAYVAFACDEHHLFTTAFAHCPVLPARPDNPSAWQVLVDAIDMLILTGAMPESRRDEAPWIAWSAVHGLASILINQAMPEPADVNRMIEHVLNGVKRALQ